MRLNGWQRLWVIISLVWVIVIGSLFATSQRSGDQNYHEWANELVEYLIKQSPDLQGRTVASVRSAYSDLSDKQLVDALHEKYLPKHPAYHYGFSEINAKYSGASVQNTQHGLVWLAAAIGVPLALYLLGLAIFWIGAGFKHA
jgi:hypothetical protein